MHTHTFLASKQFYLRIASCRGVILTISLAVLIGFAFQHSPLQLLCTKLLRTCQFLFQRIDEHISSQHVFFAPQIFHKTRSAIFIRMDYIGSRKEAYFISLREGTFTDNYYHYKAIETGIFKMAYTQQQEQV